MNKKHTLLCLKGHGEFYVDTLDEECPSCADDQAPVFSKGNRVFWTDPDNDFGSGPGTIHDINIEDGEEIAEDTVISLYMDSGSHAEVLPCEIDLIPPGGLMQRKQAIDEVQSAFREELRSCDEESLRDEYIDKIGEDPGEDFERDPTIDSVDCAFREELRTCSNADLRSEYISRLGADPGPITNGPIAIIHIHTKSELMEKIASMLTDAPDQVVGEVAVMLSEMSVVVKGEGVFEVAGEHIETSSSLIEKITSLLTDAPDQVTAEIAAMLSEMMVRVLPDGTFQVLE